MEVGNLGKKAIAYLLVAAKGHVPRRKSQEDYAMGFQVLWQQVHKTLLIMDMLYHVAQHDDIILVVGRIEVVDVVRDEGKLLLIRMTGKERSGVVNLLAIEIDTGAHTSTVKEGFEVAPLTATYLQYAAVGRHGMMVLNKGNNVCLGRIHLLVEVEQSILVSFLHSL